MEKTKAQRIMAGLLRKKGLNVVENIQLPGGEADILLPEYKVVIELDGYFHLSLENQKNDRRKESCWLEKGYQVFRFRNDEVYNQKTLCLKMITDHIRVMDGVANEPLSSPLKDHAILKKVHRILLHQEEKEKGRWIKANPKTNPEAYFLSLDGQKDNVNNDDLPKK